MTDPLKNVDVRVKDYPAPDPAQRLVQNNAGGASFQIDPWGRFMRFLILGTEGGTYYQSERKITEENTKNVKALVAVDGPRFVNTLVEVSEAGRARKVNPAIYALAVACAADDVETRKLAYAAIPRVCRIGTHLFTFAGYIQNLRGWSRGLRNAVAAWYTTPDVDKVAYQAIKYRQREGFTHRDMLRLAHPQAGSDEARKALFDFMCEREAPLADVIPFVAGYRAIQNTEHAKDAVNLISHYRLPWEAVPDKFLTEPEVWEALLDAGIGVTALIRNLSRLTRLGVIAPMAARTQWVVEQITNEDTLRKGRVHPMQILDALFTYNSGHGKGSEWTPVQQIVDALDKAFYLSFGNVEPANKRTMLCLDVSGSMGWSNIQGSGLTPRDAAAAMALITAATEPNYHVMAFCDELTPIAISPKMRLDTVIQKTSGLPFGGTDCSLPMLYAMENNIPVDTFVVYTDNETWAGRTSPHKALKDYRKKMGIDARLVVVGMTASDFTIADPTDAGMLDVVGFDTSAPNTISAFSRGEF